MRHESMNQERGEGGFSLIELLAVVGIIAVMSAVALPNIVQYAKTYRLNGALREVAGEMATARTKAIVGNVNRGVSFLIVDRNTYRYVLEDTVPPTLGPLKDLPQNIVFDVAGAHAHLHRAIQPSRELLQSRGRRVLRGCLRSRRPGATRPRRHALSARQRPRA